MLKHVLQGTRWLIAIVLGATLSAVFAGLFAEWRWSLLSETLDGIQDVFRGEVPTWIAAAFVLGTLLVVFLIVGVRRRRHRGPSIRFVRGAPLYGYDDIGFKVDDGVKWFLRVARPSQFPLLMGPRSALDRVQDLDVKGPYCPKCEFELEESKSVILGHVWKCPSGHFSKRTMVSKFTAQAKAERVFQSHFLQELRHQNPPSASSDS